MDRCSLTSYRCLKLLFIVVLVHSAACHPGREFILAFPSNRALTDKPVARVYITTSSLQSVQVTLTIPATAYRRLWFDETATALPRGQAYSRSFTLEAGTSVSHELPNEMHLLGSNIEEKGVFIQANGDITIQAASIGSLSADTYLALPVTQLGTSYFVLGYLYKRQSDLAQGPSQFAIAAAHDDTLVTISLTHEIDQNVGFDVEVKGKKLLLQLAKYETYQLQGVTDLTGSRVEATKPVVVLSGSEWTSVGSDEYGDYIIEQMIPINRWGSMYLSSPLATRSRDTFRILGASDNTNVNLTFYGKYAMRSRQIKLHQGYYSDIDASKDEFVHVASTSPVLVAQLARSGGSDDTPSDPFMVLVQPLQDYYPSYTFATTSSFHSSSPFTHFVNILIQGEADPGDFLLDGAYLTSDDFQVPWRKVPKVNFWAATLKIPDGAHRVNQKDNIPFSAMVYGFKSQAGYGFPAGILAPRPLLEPEEVWNNALKTTVIGPSTATTATTTLRMKATTLSSSTSNIGFSDTLSSALPSLVISTSSDSSTRIYSASSAITTSAEYYEVTTDSSTTAWHQDTKHTTTSTYQYTTTPTTTSVNLITSPSVTSVASSVAFHESTSSDYNTALTDYSKNAVDAGSSAYSGLTRMVSQTNDQTTPDNAIPMNTDKSSDTGSLSPISADTEVTYPTSPEPINTDDTSKQSYLVSLLPSSLSSLLSSSSSSSPSSSRQSPSSEEAAATTSSTNSASPSSQSERISNRTTTSGSSVAENSSLTDLTLENSTSSYTSINATEKFTNYSDFTSDTSNPSSFFTPVDSHTVANASVPHNSSFNTLSIDNLVTDETTRSITTISIHNATESSTNELNYSQSFTNRSSNDTDHSLSYETSTSSPDAASSLLSSQVQSNNSDFTDSVLDIQTPTSHAKDTAFSSQASEQASQNSTQMTPLTTDNRLYISQSHTFTAQLTTVTHSEPTSSSRFSTTASPHASSQTQPITETTQRPSLVEVTENHKSSQASGTTDDYTSYDLNNSTKGSNVSYFYTNSPQSANYSHFNENSVNKTTDDNLPAELNSTGGDALLVLPTAQESNSAQNKLNFIIPIAIIAGIPVLLIVCCVLRCACKERLKARRKREAPDTSTTRALRYECKKNPSTSYLSEQNETNSASRTFIYVDPTVQLLKEETEMNDVKTLATVDTESPSASTSKLLKSQSQLDSFIVMDETDLCRNDKTTKIPVNQNVPTTTLQSSTAEGVEDLSNRPKISISHSRTGIDTRNVRRLPKIPRLVSKATISTTLLDALQNPNKHETKVKDLSGRRAKRPRLRRRRARVQVCTCSHENHDVTQTDSSGYHSGQTRAVNWSSSNLESSVHSGSSSIPNTLGSNIHFTFADLKSKYPIFQEVVEESPNRSLAEVVASQKMKSIAKLKETAFHVSGDRTVTVFGRKRKLASAVRKNEAHAPEYEASAESSAIDIFSMQPKKRDWRK